MNTEAIRILLAVAGGHLVVACACVGWLFRPAAPILGIHPAWKPLKFAVSIALFLGTIAWILPALDATETARLRVARILAGTMVIEMVPIVWQPLRGTTSHFNVQGARNRLLWGVMIGAIVLATAALGWVAVVAVASPLSDPGTGGAMDPLLATGWRFGLVLTLFAAVSGFGMGGRLRHSVGGEDGGPGLAVVNWSTRHGDLRVSHFLALHALQALPITAMVLAGLPLPPSLRWAGLLSAAAAFAGAILWTWARAVQGRRAW